MLYLAKCPVPFELFVTSIQTYTHSCLLRYFFTQGNFIVVAEYSQKLNFFGCVYEFSFTVTRGVNFWKKGTTLWEINNTEWFQVCHLLQWVWAYYEGWGWLEFPEMKSKIWRQILGIKQFLNNMWKFCLTIAGKIPETYYFKKLYFKCKLWFLGCGGKG